MSRIERQQLIQAIERKRKSRVLVYVTGDRRGLETRIASDIFPLCFNHLSKMGHQKSIDLYLYSIGGITMAGYGLVNLIKEFCDSFNVIIPFKALSCATLISLGADTIIMTKMGQLSPVDPSVDHPLGPTIPVPGQPGVAQRVPVNVEDAISYLDLAKKVAGLKEDASLSTVFERLSGGVHPLTLGAVNRAREQIAFLARTLLSYHTADKAKVERIVSTITKERFSHDYLIGRKEAKQVLELNIIDVPTKLEENIVKLYQEYDKLLNLSVPYHPETVLGAANVTTSEFNRAIMESDDLTHVFRTVKEVKRVELPQPGIPIPVTGYQERILSEAWVEDNKI